MCPVCRQQRLIRTQEFDVKRGMCYFVQVPEPMYQFHEEGEPGYISPRCSLCFDKAIAEMGGWERAKLT
jgi:hypothetical protein